MEMASLTLAWWRVKSTTTICSTVCSAHSKETQSTKTPYHWPFVWVIHRWHSNAEIIMIMHRAPAANKETTKFPACSNSMTNMMAVLCCIRFGFQWHPETLLRPLSPLGSSKSWSLYSVNTNDYRCIMGLKFHSVGNHRLNIGADIYDRLMCQ